MMAAAGILGEYKGSQAREVIMTLKEYEAMREKMEAEAEYKEPEEEDAAEEDRSEADVGEEEFAKDASN